MQKQCFAAFGDKDGDLKGSRLVCRLSGTLWKAGAGVEPHDPTINPLVYKKNDTQYQVVRGGCGLALSLSWSCEALWSMGRAAGSPRRTRNTGGGGGGVDADTAANVRSAAHGAMAAHVDGLADNSNKRSRGPQISNTAKIESLYTLVNTLEATTADTVRFVCCCWLCNPLTLLCNPAIDCYGVQTIEHILSMVTRMPTVLQNLVMIKVIINCSSFLSSSTEASRDRTLNA